MAMGNLMRIHSKHERITSTLEALELVLVHKYAGACSYLYLNEPSESIIGVPCRSSIYKKGWK